MDHRDLDQVRSGSLDWSVGALSIYCGEVDCLGSATHLARHFFKWNVEDQHRRLAVDVSARAKCLNERGIGGKMREQTKLYLRVVRGEKIPFRTRNEPSP